MIGTIIRKRFEDVHARDQTLLSIPQNGRMQMTDCSNGATFIHAIAITMRGGEATGCVDQNGQAYDFVTRWFSPWTGQAEAKAEGTAQLALAEYWARILQQTDLYSKHLVNVF